MPAFHRKLHPKTTPRAFFFTGAGLSADSGVPTFYGANGAYGRFANPEDIVSKETLKRDPQLLNRFIDDMRVDLGKAEPNAAHHMIARLCHDYGDTVVHMTQNIDDLMERAGCYDSVHLHGFLTRLRQVANPTITEDIGYRRYWDGDPELAPEKGFKFRGAGNNSWYRPDVVLFDEAAPEYEKLLKLVGSIRTKKAIPLGSDDIAIVIGTRGAVVPIGQMMMTLRCRKVLVNLHHHEEIGEHFFDTVIHARAADAAGSIEDMVRRHLGMPNHPVSEDYGPHLAGTCPEVST